MQEFEEITTIFRLPFTIDTKPTSKRKPSSLHTDRVKIAENLYKRRSSGKEYLLFRRFSRTSQTQT